MSLAPVQECLIYLVQLFSLTKDCILRSEVSVRIFVAIS